MTLVSGLTAQLGHVQGLENEYDRLLAELDKTQRRLRIADPSYTGGGEPRSKDT